MRVQVAMVYGSEEEFISEQIMKLDGETPYSHAGFIFTLPTGEKIWFDMKFRWFVSSWRVFPAENYAWDYDLYDIVNLREIEAERLYSWATALSGHRINYAFAQCIFQWVTWKLGLPVTRNPFENSGSMHCFEAILRGLEVTGRHIAVDPGLVLAKDLVHSGYLKFVEKHVACSK